MTSPTPVPFLQPMQSIREHLHSGRFAQAELLCRQILASHPTDLALCLEVGNALCAIGRFEEAAAAYQRGVDLAPDCAPAHSGLGIALFENGRVEQSMASFQRAVALNPAEPELHLNLAKALNLCRMDEQSLAAARKAASLRPDWHEPYLHIGNALMSCGELQQAIAAYRRGVQLKPDWVTCHSNLIYALHFDPAYDAAAIFSEHDRWRQQHAEPLRPLIRPHANDPDPDRRLRVGYVSPDFRDHPIGRFLLPLVEHHDRARFEVFCYSDVTDRRADAITARYRQSASCWRPIAGMADAQVAEMIRSDRIDLLVDLTMHMADHRLLVFARKPAPVQVTYLAYAGTTGLDTIDYRITDPYLDPIGQPDSLYSERSIRLPRTYWCYEAPSGSPPIPDPPAHTRGYVTFGCLNNICKLSAPALTTWSFLLREVPNSRLLIHAPPGSARLRILNALAQHQIESSRVDYFTNAPFDEYLKAYQGIDISLDPFPYNGGTTTCDALWMGVPVVTLTGATAVGRAGSSLLSNIGLHELIASSPEDYVKIAAELARDLPRLRQLRESLRDRMKASPLMDGRQFAHDVELAYRAMWQEAHRNDRLRQSRE